MPYATVSILPESDWLIYKPYGYMSLKVGKTKHKFRAQNSHPVTAGLITKPILL